MSVFEFGITIKMLSDWHIGSGKGRQGAVDALVRRDGDGCVFVPVSTLRGVWRDAAEQLAFVLDGNATTGLWQNAVAHLFGSQPNIDQRGKDGRTPLSSRLTLTAARLEPALRNVLVADKTHRLRDALVFVKPGVAINPETGSAAANMLRFVEMSRMGAVLESTAAIKLEGIDDESDRQKFQALAQCSAAMITSLGGDRRRGAGRCEISLKNGTLATAVETLKKAESAPLAPQANPDRKAVNYSAQRDGSFRVFPVTIQLESPVIIAEDILGNTTTTRNQIPGTALLGPVLKAAGISGADTAIVNGDIRVLPAYPAAQGVRTTPTPQCWREKKDDGEYPDMLNLLVQAEPDNEVWKAAAGAFTLPADDKPQFVSHSVSIYTHNSVHDESQAPNSKVGGVYTYEAISAGQVFQAQLWVRDGLDITVNSGTRDAFIGRAVNAGYGHVRITVGDRQNETFEVGQFGGKTALYFATDCLLPAFSSPEAGLIKLLSRAGITAQIEKSYIRVVRLEGWMPRAGLSKTSQTAIQAGSVVLLDEVKGDCSVLARNGLGQRRAEGFGVVQVNPGLLTGDLDKKGDDLTADRQSRDTAASASLSDNSEIFLEAITATSFKSWIREQAELYAGDKCTDLIKQSTETSQLGSLRSVMGTLGDSDAIETTHLWLKKKVADKKTWAKNLSDLFGNPKSVWNKFNDSDLLPAWRALADGGKGNNELSRYALLSLTHACIRAHKRQSENKTEKEVA